MKHQLRSGAWQAIGVTFATLLLALLSVNMSRTFRAQTVPPENTSPLENIAKLFEASITESGASGTGVTLFLRPHCTQEEASSCPPFSVRDPLTLETSLLRKGHTLDMDIVVRNATKLPLERVRAWLQYDPQILNSTRVEIGPAFPIAAPGEKDADATKGYVMLDTESATPQGMTGSFLTVANIIFTVKTVPAGGETVITFYDPVGNPPHTAAYTAGITGNNVLTQPLGTLAVMIEENSSVSSVTGSGELSSAPAASASGTIASSAAQAIVSSTPPSVDEHPAPSEPTVTPTRFVLLQPQNIRVTTEGTTLYIAWDALPSPELTGFHVYYGTEAGRYIQRRTVRPDQKGIAIRSLAEGTHYYVAVRGFNAANEETAFSQEAAVIIGNPQSSTDPLQSLAGLGGENPLQGQVGSVPGNSGLGSTTTLLLAVSAAIGTLVAFRRQTLASPTIHV